MTTTTTTFCVPCRAKKQEEKEERVKKIRNEHIKSKILLLSLFHWHFSKFTCITHVCGEFGQTKRKRPQFKVPGLQSTSMGGTTYYRPSFAPLRRITPPRMSFSPAVIRKLTERRRRVEGRLERRDVTREYGDPGSAAFAPLTRIGVFPDRNADNFVVKSRYLSTYEGEDRSQAAEAGRAQSVEQCCYNTL